MRVRLWAQMGRRVMAREDGLWQAVEKACVEDAEGAGVEQQMMLTNYILIAARAGIDDEGDSITQIHIIPEAAATHVMLGLLDQAQVRIRADLMERYLD